MAIFPQQSVDPALKKKFFFSLACNKDRNMSILVQWVVGSRQAKSVVAVKSEEERWAALMNYLTKSNILFVAQANYEYPTQVGMFCFAQKDGTYCIYQAVETPDWDPGLGPAPIYALEVAYLDWVWVPIDKCEKPAEKPDDKKDPPDKSSGSEDFEFALPDFLPKPKLVREDTTMDEF